MQRCRAERDARVVSRNREMAMKTQRGESEMSENDSWDVRHALNEYGCFLTYDLRFVFCFQFSRHAAAALQMARYKIKAKVRTRQVMKWTAGLLICGERLEERVRPMSGCVFVYTACFVVHFR